MHSLTLISHTCVFAQRGHCLAQSRLGEAARCVSAAGGGRRVASENQLSGTGVSFFAVSVGGGGAKSAPSEALVCVSVSTGEDASGASGGRLGADLLPEQPKKTFAPP